MKAFLKQYRIALLLFLPVLAYVVYRAASLSLTHDEALSFTIVKGDATWKVTANHHWLNTWLMKLTHGLFGSSELALRLPNVLAFVLYGWASAKLLRSLTLPRHLVYVAFAAMLSSQLVLDFFGLARGYGLALAFLIAAFHFLLNEDHKWKPRFFAALLFSFYANFSFLVPIGILAFLELLHRQSNYLPIRKTRWKQLLPPLLFGLLMLPGVQRLFFLSAQGQLYLGSDHDMLHSTVFSWMMTFAASINQMEDALIYFAWLVGGMSFIGLLLWKRSKLAAYSAVLILGYLLGMELLHQFKSIPYPVERSILFLSPLTSLLLWGIVEGFWSLHKAMRVPAILLILALVPAQFYSFSEEANLRYTQNFRGDANIKQLLKAVDQNRKEDTVSIGIPWYLEPSMNYYRRKDDLTWLRPLNRNGISDTFSFYVIEQSTEATFNGLPLTFIDSFPTSGMNLFRRDVRIP